MDLEALRIFRAVAQEGGISRAAAKLHRVQSNVSTRVKQLETELGTSLFRRGNRKLVLSPEGEHLLVYADRLLHLSAEAEATIRGGKPRGTFRIGALESTAGSRLPPLLARYHRAYPEVRLELTTGTTGTLVNKVLRSEIEAAFVSEPFSPTGLETEAAFEEELVLIAPKSAPKIRSAKEIGRRSVIAFATGCSYRRRLEEWLAAGKVTPERVLEFGSYHALLACVAAGIGVAVAPRSILKLFPKRFGIAVHRLPRAIARSTTRLIWRPGHHSPAFDALRRDLKRLVGRNPVRQ